MNSQASSDPIEPYTLLRAALNLFKKPPMELEAHQLRQVRIQARNEYEIESRVLCSQEAAGVMVSDEAVQRAFIEVSGRFENVEAFAAALAANGLDEEGLRQALARQSKVDAVMERVSSQAPCVNEVEIGIFYHSHPEKFHLPEQRFARHILISINPEYPENSRENARQRIDDIAETLQRKPHKFAELALKNSECPSALNNGELGAITRGQLFPELDAVLFKLKAHQVSAVVETEVGFHLIQCQKIVPAETLSLLKATPKIKQLMQERYRRNCQRTWLASLMKSTG